MGQGSIPKQVLQGLKQVAVETVEKTFEETGKITESVITGKELLGGITSLSPEEMAKRKQEDEMKKKQEEEKIKQQMKEMGRNVESEIKEVRDEKKRKEDEEERAMLRQIEQQRQAEEQERAQMMAAQEAQTPGHKKKKSRGSAFAKGKKSQPSTDQMSQTQEFKGKVD